jgi:hypothetical protein
MRKRKRKYLLRQKQEFNKYFADKMNKAASKAALLF